MPAQSGPDYPAALWSPSRSYAHHIGRRTITAIILHSGDGTRLGDLETLTATHSASAHYYISRAGHAWQLVREQDVAYHCHPARKPIWENRYTLGIEQEHIDHRDDWPDAQILAVARLVAHIRTRRGPIPLLGHAAVCKPPGYKIDPADYPWAELHVSLQRIADTIAAHTAMPT
jgi:N-acetylmuramoyl-L-alanine amidase